MLRKKKRARKGYSLVELMVVITIMAILAAASIGIYTGYVERARKAALYETADQIKQALAVCEAEYASGDNKSSRAFWSEGFLKPPNHPDSYLYPYVGETTKDCTDFSLKVGKDSGGTYHVTGFTYETEEYEVIWSAEDGITIEKK